MKNARTIKEIIDNNVITKSERKPVGASIARPLFEEHATENVGAILIVRKLQGNNLRKTQEGITLIALVITIIVLLILASITINLTLGERGIFNTAKKAVENYKEAEEKELADLENFEQEARNVINGIGNGNQTPTEPKGPTLTSQITPANYGDYVDYPVSIGRGPNEAAHKTDWRIFYKNEENVYLIASYYLLNSEMPEGTGMVGYSERPYTTYWGSTIQNYTPITDEVRSKYKMSWNQNTTNTNIKRVSTLLNTNLWTKFVNTTYAEDAIGTPTLEMWIESWNTTGNMLLYCNNSNENGYYLGTSKSPTTYLVNGVSTSNSLYFPTTSYNDATGGYYWLASPSAYRDSFFMNVYSDGRVGDYTGYEYSQFSVRPLVRLKSNVTSIKDANGIWQLK